VEGTSKGAKFVKGFLKLHDVESLERILRLHKLDNFDDILGMTYYVARNKGKHEWKFQRKLFV